MPPPPSETPHLLARQMFFIGCLGLPWLWCVNFLYFRKQVYGPTFPWDNNDDDDNEDDQFGDIMNLGGAMSEDTSDDEGDTDDNTGYEDDTTVQLPTEEEQQLLKKWVNRSLRGSISLFVIFLAWIISFQSFKDQFSYRWFQMSQDQGEATGW
uniref:Gamma-secretase subunit PEN-2 n=1 Tax=Proboscia inermis TaxID=420281 RepID=A0A7S0GGV0_9STRA|mmetsp:Transcript_47591/g.48019  ORF Transcript_47591/g.48019 Transcript_47591/m.48019 type:complete len:153 (+) Transcript_47591:35-493(+)